MDAGLMLCAAVLLAPQVPGTAISGTVRDAETGASLRGVLVSLSDLSRTTTTDSLGGYSLAEVPPGWHELTAGRLGYLERTVRVLVPDRGGSVVTIALQARPVPVADLEIRASRPPLTQRMLPDGFRPASGPAERSVTIEQLRLNPFLAEPDFLTALGGGGVTVGPEEADGLHRAGAPGDQLAYSLDGIPVFNPYHTAGTFSAWNPDAISRLDLLSGTPGAGALSGEVQAQVRTPLDPVQLAGATSATQARLTLGAAPRPGVTALVGVRTGFAGLAGHQSDPTYLGGQNHDWIARIGLPLAGGQLGLLGAGNGNRLGAWAEVGSLPANAGAGRHQFEWDSRSLGAVWKRDLSATTLEIRSWLARTDAGARWVQAGTSQLLTSQRRDLGAAITVRQGDWRQTTTVTLSASSGRTGYRIQDPAGSGVSLAGRTPVVTLTLEHARAFSNRTGARLGLAATRASTGVGAAPTAGLWWLPAPGASVSVSYTRHHQYYQSLRNPESPTGMVFPADLWVGVDGGGIPVARSDEGVLSLGLTSGPDFELRLRGFVRAATGLALVAPGDAGPFSTRPPELGRSSASGASAEATYRRGRTILRAGYAAERVRVTGPVGSWQPMSAVPQQVVLGALFEPRAGASVRLGFTGLLGRRATLVQGPFEWESCNLRDRGCEFAGTPALAGPLGDVALPAYLRMDLGFRYQWQAEFFGRRGLVAGFATLSNLFARRNLLTSTRDPATGRTEPVEMRPFAPLVFGLDWSF